MVTPSDSLDFLVIRCNSWESLSNPFLAASPLGCRKLQHPLEIPKALPVRLVLPAHKKMLIDDAIVHAAAARRDS